MNTCVRLRASSGFTLVEMLVSTAVVVIVVAAIVAVLGPSQTAFLAQPEVSDIQQRLRIGADALTTDLLMAGAGTSMGPSSRTLGTLTATILPRRIGSLRPDSETTVTNDRISILYVPPTASQTTIRDPLSSAAGPIPVDDGPGCPRGQNACGFTTGMTLVVFDDTGASDAFKVTSVSGSTVQVRHQGGALTKPYDAGAPTAEVATVTYWFDTTSARLMKYDGDRSDLPVLENVVSLRFDYFGEPRAPELIRPPTDPVGPWTTFGPKPPPQDVDDAADSWGAGENCIFRVDHVTAAHVARLSDLGGGDASLGGLVPLTADLLADGPWCPDSAAPNRFDADLLRIRLVRVTLRVQAARAALRGPAGPLFSRGGTARGAGRVVPDRELRFDVAPRNLNLGR